MQLMTLKQARRKRQLTLDELEDLTGVHKTTLSRLERGWTRPMLHTAQQIELALGTRIDFSRVA